MIRIDSETKVKIIARAADDKKAENILILDLRKHSAFADYFLICSAASQRAVQAVCDNIVEVLQKKGERVWHVEGYEYGQWVVVDAIDTVVHIFSHEMRSYYDLEHLWQDAVFVNINEFLPH
ncbi:MAG: ribosome silencing factor [Candidatus Omnitrophota bacterium]